MKIVICPFHCVNISTKTTYLKTEADIKKIQVSSIKLDIKEICKKCKPCHSSNLQKYFHKNVIYIQTIGFTKFLKDILKILSF